MSRLFVAVCALALTLSACSGSDPRTVASTPTAPTDLAAVTPDGTGVSGPTAMPSPPRNETVDFRNQLETKYQSGLNRSASITAVDREGEAIWIQEYIRYRVSGCDHGTSVQRVMSQIDGGAGGADCGASPTGAVAVPFPSRADVVTFRQQLETRYLQMNRGLVSSFVDAEGAAIWTSEYLRYRTNDCDHATAVQKTLTQVDGNAAPATCVPVNEACSYRFGAAQEVPAAGGNFSVSIHKVTGTGACTWTVTNSSSFITNVDPITSAGSGPVNFRVSQNNGSLRSGNLRFDYPGGSITYQVVQTASPYSVFFTMVDGFKSTGTTTECEIRSTATPCTFTASSNLPGNQTYNWRLVYTYGIDKTLTQSSSSNTFVLTEGCGGSTSSSDGAFIDISMTLTMRDDRGNEVVVQSGQGSQPALRIKAFRC